MLSSLRVDTPMAHQHVRTLIIDDNELDFMITQRSLLNVKSPRHFKIDWAETYKGGLEKLANDRFDIILVDYHLDQDTGPDFVKDARSKGINTPFILLTAYENPSYLEEVITHGIYDYIIKKEATPGMLDRSIAYALKRYATERQLDTALSYNNFVLKESSIFTVHINEEFKIIEANDNFCALLEITRDAVHYSDFYEHFVENIALLEHIKDQKHFRAKLTKAGKIVSWRVTKDKFFPHSKFTLIGQDITAEIQEEKAKRQADNMTALGQLSGGIAHELNNLMLPILLNAERILDEQGEAYKPACRIKDCAESAAKVIKDILGFAHADEQNIRLHDIAEESLQALEFCRASIPPSVEMHIEGFEEEGCMAAFDRKDWVRIFANIMLNAAQAMELSGAITITSRWNTADSEYNICFADTGPGIPEDILGQIFEPFFTTKQVGDGTGLGLSIVYKMIAAIGGTIEAQNRKEGGAQFLLTISVHAAEP